MKRAFSAVPDFTYGVISRFAGSCWAAIEWVMSGTHQGDFSGDPSHWQSLFVGAGTTLLELEAGKIRGESDYWDAATFMKQVGPVPSS